jgi:glycosyltransferase involved in cell wall biosynthesis
MDPRDAGGGDDLRRRAGDPDHASRRADDPMSILYVTARYPPFVGGTEIHTAEVAQRMVKRGHDVTVLTTAFEPLPTGEEFVSGVRVVRVRARPADVDFYIAPGVASYVRRHRWDIVHCQGYHTFVAPLAMGAALLTKQPLIVTFHSGGHSSRLRRWLRPVQQLALRPMLARADRLIGVSKFETDFFRRRLHLPPSRFETITNGVAREFIDVDVEPSEHESVVCSVGRLERYKGHHRVIEALPRIRDRVPDVRLRIVGDGPYRRQLEQLAARLDVADIVEFVVIRPEDRKSMAELFRSAHLVTLLSDYESQGVVGLEALAVGRPLVVADGTALAELGQYGDVSIVPPGADAATIGAMIVRTLQETATGGRSFVPMWDQTVEALEAVYADVLAARSSGSTTRA